MVTTVLQHVGTTSTQATVYDDAHMGDSLAVVVHFTNKATQHAPGGVRLMLLAHSTPTLAVSQDLTTCAWVNVDNTSHPHGDAMLVRTPTTRHPHHTPPPPQAVAGRDQCISCISLVESRVVSLLQGRGLCTVCYALQHHHVGHTRPVLDVAGASACPGRVASLAEGGDVRLWDAIEERCLGTVDVAGATCLVRHGGAWLTCAPMCRHMTTHTGMQS